MFWDFCRFMNKWVFYKTKMQLVQMEYLKILNIGRYLYIGNSFTKKLMPDFKALNLLLNKDTCNILILKIVIQGRMLFPQQHYQCHRRKYFNNCLKNKIVIQFKLQKITLTSINSRDNSIVVQ